MPTRPPLILIDVNAPNPEDVLVMPDGTLYVTAEDGQIIHISADHSLTTVANTGGRPLGIELMDDGHLLVCDCKRGLLKIDPSSGSVETLIPRGEHSLRFCNNASIAKDGRIFFSDSSQRYEIDDADKDVGERIGTGRLLCRHPDGRVEVLLDGLYFANGVALAPDESHVLHVESGNTHINRVWLTGPKAGQHGYLPTTLPALPDNMSIGSDSLVWIALVAPLTDTLQALWKAPRIIRGLVALMPTSWFPEQPQICRIVAIDLDGNIVHDLEGDPTQINTTTGVREHNGNVYIGSINSRAIGVMTL